MNQTSKNELTAQWWQYFLNNIPQAGVNFVMGKMLVPNDKQIYETNTIVYSDELIILPIDNWISLVQTNKISFLNRKKVEKEMIRIADEKMNRLVQMSLSIDRNRIEPSQRITSTFFDVLVNGNNRHMLKQLELGEISNGKYRALSDGYWLFLEASALGLGEHEIETFGSCSTGVLSLQLKHHVTVIS